MKKTYQPATKMWSQIDPDKAPLRFKARNLKQAKSWQNLVRKELNAAIGYQDEKKVPPRPRVLERVDKGDYIREKVEIQTMDLASMPVYLLYPKKIDKPLATVLAFHGHGYGVKDIVGLWEDGTERDTPSGYHKDFAVELCRRGFFVAAPEISCFGERQNDYSKIAPAPAPPSTCFHTGALALHVGKSVVGLRAWDGKRLVDYLGTRKEADIKRLGAMGISGGGLHSLFSTALDTRIKACVISGYYCTFEHSILAMHHCLCNYVPNLARFGEMYDLIGLVAPRPVLVESASKDYIFPIAQVKKSVAKTRKLYQVFSDDAELVQTDYFEGRHEISGVKSYDFLLKHLS